MSCTTANSGKRPASTASCGVPSRCWCGKKAELLVCKTNENQYRRFYRCEVALQRRTESHLFRWVEIAMAEEFSYVHSRIEDVVVNLSAMCEDLKAQGKRLTAIIEKQQAALENWLV